MFYCFDNRLRSYGATAVVTVICYKHLAALRPDRLPQTSNL